MDDDDEVVEEIDVFLSKTLSDQLVILQYPSRPKSYTSNIYQEIIAARLKPKQQKIELEYALDTRCYNYDRAKGEQIATGVDGDKSSQTYYKSNRMDKHSYVSTKSVTCGSRYSVGVLQNGALHLNPINAIFQMRSNFEYLDKSDAESKKDNKEDDPAEEAEVVTVKFAGPTAERAKKAREKSFRYLQQKLESEPWVPATYHHFGSPRCKRERLQLLCRNMSHNSTRVFSSPEEYLRTLLPKALLESRLFTKAVLNDDELLNVMIEAKVLQFKQICERMRTEPTSNLQKALQKIAYLVQGCWVVKSDMLYNKDRGSPVTGLPGETFIRARNYIMWNFNKTRCLKRSNILPLLKIPVEDVTNTFAEVAKKVYNQGWEFRYPYDQEFVDSHPDIVQRQELLWEVCHKQLLREFRLEQDAAPKKSFPSPPRPRERRQLKYRESISDDTEESGAESTLSDKMDIDSPVKKMKPAKRNYTARKRSFSSPTKSPAKIHQQHISAVEISPSFLMTLPSVEVKSELLNHVREVLFQRCCITVAELKDSLAEADLDYIARREDCDAVLEETLTKVGAQRLKNKWPQNTQPILLYAFTNFGTAFDRYRDALLDLFTNTARSRPNFLVKKIEDEHGEIISETLCKQIFDEYCTYKAGFYYLKGTVSPDP